MKTILIFSLIIIQSCIAFAQSFCTNDSIVREIQLPLTGQDSQTVFYYFNDEWISGAYPDMVPADSIQKMEVKNDEYDNQAIFLTVSPEIVDDLKAKTKNLWIHDYPLAEFPGGNGKLKEWLDNNIKIPDGYKEAERVPVTFTLHPDGSISNPKILLPSKNEAVNEEALRLVNALPKFRIKYCTPKKSSFRYNISISFKEPEAIFIRDCETTFIVQLPIIETKIKQLYENVVFGTATDPDFLITDICTDDFLRRLKGANDMDSNAYATWLLRSGMQDGDDTPSIVTSIIPGADNTVVVSWSDMGHNGQTTFTLVESDDEWKINNSTVPEGYNPL